MRYREGLAGLAARHVVRLPIVPSECDQSYHMFYMLMPSKDARQQLMDRLAADGILSVFHYVPLHSSPQGVKFGGGDACCPVSEWASERLVRLPFYRGLSEAEQDDVIESVGRVFSRLARVAV
jgi:dTDP-4-amino-4,6-dideoxygalactose transaminase